MFHCHLMSRCIVYSSVILDVFEDECIPHNTSSWQQYYAEVFEKNLKMKKVFYSSYERPEYSTFISFSDKLLIHLVFQMHKRQKDRWIYHKAFRWKNYYGNFEISLALKKKSIAHFKSLNVLLSFNVKMILPFICFYVR